MGVSVVHSLLYTHANSLCTQLRRTHGDQRKVVARGQVSGSSTCTRPDQQMQRLSRSETGTKLLRSKRVEHFGTWNVCTLRGLSKSQLAQEMLCN